MTLTNDELLVIRGDMENDPLNLGLTMLPEDDEANSIKLNEVRESIQVYRASVPSDDIVIPRDEYGALTPADRDYWTSLTNDGTINPAATVTQFNLMFGANTQARVLFESVCKEPASRARQLLERYVNLTPSDISAARVAT